MLLHKVLASGQSSRLVTNQTIIQELIKSKPSFWKAIKSACPQIGFLNENGLERLFVGQLGQGESPARLFAVVLDYLCTVYEQLPKLEVVEKVGEHRVLAFVHGTGDLPYGPGYRKRLLTLIGKKSRLSFEQVIDKTARHFQPSKESPHLVRYFDNKKVLGARFAGQHELFCDWAINVYQFIQQLSQAKRDSPLDEMARQALKLTVLSENFEGNLRDDPSLYWWGVLTPIAIQYEDLTQKPYEKLDNRSWIWATLLSVDMAIQCHQKLAEDPHPRTFVCGLAHRYQMVQFIQDPSLIVETLSQLFARFEIPLELPPTKTTTSQALIEWVATQAYLKPILKTALRT